MNRLGINNKDSPTKRTRLEQVIQFKVNGTGVAPQVHDNTRDVFYDIDHRLAPIREYTMARFP
jgi:hypothetical protein